MENGSMLFKEYKVHIGIERSSVETSLEGDVAREEEVGKKVGRAKREKGKDGSTIDYPYARNSCL